MLQNVNKIKNLSINKICDIISIQISKGSLKWQVLEEVFSALIPTTF